MGEKKRRSRGVNGNGGFTRVKGKYVARLTIPTPEGPRRRSKTLNTRADAEAWLREQIKTRDEKQGRVLAFDPETLTVSEWCVHWLEGSVRASVAPGTYRVYEQDVRRRVTPLIGSVPLGKLMPAHIELMKNELLKTLAPTTVSQTMRSLSAALNQAVAWGLISESPTKHVKRPKAPKNEMRCMTEEEAAQLMQQVKGTREEALYLVALKCGLRAGELAGLTWSDFSNKTLTVSRSVMVRHGVPEWGPTKGQEERSITLGDKLIASLERHRKAQAAEKLACPDTWLDASLMFPDERGGVQTHYDMLRRFRKHLEAAGLPGMKLHDCRHTAASLMLSSGVDIYTTARVLGHKDPAITLRVYSHVLPNMSERAADAMNALSF